MLSSLPPELLREIIESTVPHTYHSTTYTERQDTLRSLCLVSHRFRQIAQPLLFEIVWIYTGALAARVERLKDEQMPGSERLGKTRCLVFASFYQHFDRDELSEFLGMFPFVRKINLYGAENVDVSIFETLTHLTELQLQITQTTRLTNLKNTVLSTVRCLTLSTVSWNTVATLLNPTVLPNLAVFALMYFDEVSLEALAKTHFDRLLPQLEALFFNYDFWQLPKAAFLHSFANRTLIDISSWNIKDLHHSDFAIVNARIYNLTWSGDGNPTETFFAKLDHLASFFEESHPSLPLRLLYLDVSLQPTLSNPPRLRKCIDRLATACRERKVEIVFEKGPRAYNFDFFISPDFARRQKAKSGCGDVERR